jgi:hypothetical protein
MLLTNNKEVHNCLLAGNAPKLSLNAPKHEKNACHCCRKALLLKNVRNDGEELVSYRKLGVVRVSRDFFFYHLNVKHI